MSQRLGVSWRHTSPETSITPSPCAAFQQNTRFNIVRAGVNYHFNWGVAPIVAKY
jgi:hypothetical protein